MGHAALENVHEEIGFNENLIIDAVDVRVRVVVADEVADALCLLMGIAARGQHFECDGRAFHLLVRAVAVAVFFKTRWISFSKFSTKRISVIPDCAITSSAFGLRPVQRSFMRSGGRI